MALSFFALTTAQKAFVLRVEAGLCRNFDPAQVAVYGDGTCSPNGEKFTAVREGASWRLVYDFGTGECYHTAVQLPSDWRAMYRQQRAAA